jgi:polyisoprenyl-teichoic acid--peptidoglycan teichoic acid transferase
MDAAYDQPVPSHRRPRLRRTWPQRLVLGFSCCFVVVMLATAGGLAYVYGKYSQLPRVALGGVLSERSTQDRVRNILVVGVDSAEGLDEADPVTDGRPTGLRSDTIMILRTDPGQGRALLLSLPRDLWVPLASGGSQRINGAIQVGGPSELIATIESYLAIPINHYVQVDFAGFQDLVGAVGGVPIGFQSPARDRASGLVVPEAGCITLDPAQALAFVRSRSFQTFEDGRWRTDPTGDLGRISRQQDFIARALRRAVDQGLRNPVRLDALVDVALGSVVVDDVLTADDILDLGSRFRSFDPDNLELFSLPVVDDTIGGAAILRLVEREAQPILDRFRGTIGEGVEPSSVRIRVLNGSGRSGEARETLEALRAAGFAGGGTGEAETFDVARTVVRHEPGRRDAAELVVRWLQGGAVIQEVDEDLGADVVLVTGADFDGLRDVPVPSTSTTEAEPAPGRAPAGTTEPPPGPEPTDPIPPDDPC